MQFDARKNEALAILAKTKIRQSSYKPFGVQLLWRLGVKVPPPHFARFWSVTVAYGVWFASAWGLLMWFAQWSSQGIPVWGAAVGSAVAGLIFGLSMAAYYAYGRHKYELPQWQSLGEVGSRT